MTSKRKLLALALAAPLAALAGWGPAAAQTKLKWAHVYETGEPYHTEAVWAAEEIKKRTNGKYQIDVFPASQLGNENQINEGLGLATVDMIYTGVAFGCLLMFARQIHNVWKTARQGWTKPHDVVDQATAD